jgi:hypothetical protein
LVFLDHFDTLILKIIFKKYYFDTFLNKKQPQQHSQTKPLQGGVGRTRNFVLIKIPHKTIIINCEKVINQD